MDYDKKIEALLEEEQEIEKHINIARKMKENAQEEADKYNQGYLLDDCYRVIEGEIKFKDLSKGAKVFMVAMSPILLLKNAFTKKKTILKTCINFALSIIGSVLSAVSIVIPLMAIVINVYNNIHENKHYKDVRKFLEREYDYIKELAEVKIRRMELEEEYKKEVAFEVNEYGELVRGNDLSNIPVKSNNVENEETKKFTKRKELNEEVIIKKEESIL